MKEPCWWCKGADGQCEYPKTRELDKCPICGCDKSQGPEVREDPNKTCATGRCD